MERRTREGSRSRDGPPGPPLSAQPGFESLVLSSLSFQCSWAHNPMLFIYISFCLFFFNPMFSSYANITTRFEWFCPRLVVSSSTTRNKQDKTLQAVEGQGPGSKLWLVMNKILKFLRKPLFPSSPIPSFICLSNQLYILMKVPWRKPELGGRRGTLMQPRGAHSHMVQSQNWVSVPLSFLSPPPLCMSLEKRFVWI